MLRLSLLPLLVLLALAALAPPLGLAFVVPLARPGFQKHQPHHHHRRRHAGFQVHASASASASTPPFPFESNVEMLRASLRLLGTHERQKAQDWEASLVDAGREMVIAKMMAQICDTRVALLDFAEEHIRQDYGFHGPSSRVWLEFAGTEEGGKWLSEFERVGVFKETPIEVLEEEGLAGVLQEAMAVEDDEEEDEEEENQAEAEAAEEEDEESWVGQAWEMAEKAVKGATASAPEGKAVVGRWTGPEEWERSVAGRDTSERMPEEWEMGEREGDPSMVQSVPEGWEMGAQVEGESEVGSQTGWEVGPAHDEDEEEGGKEAEGSWLD